MTRDIEKVYKFSERLKNHDPNALISLKGLKKESKEKLIDIAHKFIRDYSFQSFPHVEATLVERYLNQPKFISKKFDIVTGPISVTEMSSLEHDQIFYLFGDQLTTICEIIYFYRVSRTNLIENSIKSNFYPRVSKDRKQKPIHLSLGQMF